MVQTKKLRRADEEIVLATLRNTAGILTDLAEVNLRKPPEEAEELQTGAESTEGVRAEEAREEKKGHTAREKASSEGSRDKKKRKEKKKKKETKRRKEAEEEEPIEETRKAETPVNKEVPFTKVKEEIDSEIEVVTVVDKVLKEESLKDQGETLKRSKEEVHEGLSNAVTRYVEDHPDSYGLESKAKGSGRSSQSSHQRTKPNQGTKPPEPRGPPPGHHGGARREREAEREERRRSRSRRRGTKGTNHSQRGTDYWRGVRQQQGRRPKRWWKEPWHRR